MALFSSLTARRKHKYNREGIPGSAVPGNCKNTLVHCLNKGLKSVRSDRVKFNFQRRVRLPSRCTIAWVIPMVKKTRTSWQFHYRLEHRAIWFSGRVLRPSSMWLLRVTLPWWVWNLESLVFVEGWKLENPEKRPLSRVENLQHNAYQLNNYKPMV